MRWVLVDIWASKYGTMWSDTYSLNVFAIIGRTVWITAAISNTTTVDCLAAAERPVGALMHLRMSDYVSDRINLRSARLGGSL